MSGNIALADDLFSENVRTNGVLVGVAGPKRKIEERLAAFSDLTTTIEDMFSAHDKSRCGWPGAERIPADMGGQGYWQAGGGPRLCRLALRSWQGDENLDDTGSVRASKADRISPRRGPCGALGAR
jgi:hypothetical protein